MHENCADHVLEGGFTQFDVRTAEEDIDGGGDLFPDRVLGVVKPFEQQWVHFSELLCVDSFPVYHITCTWWRGGTFRPTNN